MKKTLRNLFLVVIAVAAAACGRPSRPSTIGTTPEVERRVDRLLAQMTLAEKIGQMNQVSAGGAVSNYAESVRSGQIGSILNEVDPVRINEFQRIAVEESRLGIPLLVGRDVIHGFHTVFPIPLGLAASFDHLIHGLLHAIRFFGLTNLLAKSHIIFASYHEQTGNHQ